MASFTKTYNVEPTDVQRESLGRACLTSVGFWVNSEKRDIFMTVNREEVKGGIAAIFVQKIEGSDYEFPMGEVYIGKRGGIHRNTLMS